MNKNIINILGKFTPGMVFHAQDFSDFAPRNTIDQILHRLYKRGDIRKINTGLYSIPQVHPLFGNVPSDPDMVAKAYAQKFGHTIQVNPAKAANLLGLSSQVPAQIVYLTDGPNKSIVADGMTIKFQHVCSKKLKGAGTKAGLVIQTLYYFGVDSVSNDLVQQIRSLLLPSDQSDLHDLFVFTPAWMQKIITRILSDA